jgi:hypothetical protein
VTSTMKGKTAADAQAAIPTVRAGVMKNAAIARYVGDFFDAQVAKVYEEVTGLTLPDRKAEVQAQQQHIAWHHGHAHATSR